MKINNDMLLGVLHEKLLKDGMLLINISGSSMSPTFQHGDSVKIFIYNFDDLKIGDIIAYKKFNDHLTVHRIKDIIKRKSANYILTQGDNNTQMDKYYITKDEYWGKIELPIKHIVEII